MKKRIVIKKTENPYLENQVLERDAWIRGNETDPNEKGVILNPYSQDSPKLRSAWAKGRMALLTDIRPIPKGIYCHGPLISEDSQDGTVIFKSPHMCPYWSMNPEKAEQEGGYCSFLEVGDWENKGPWLLWDQVKECGINRDDDLEEDESSDE